MSEQHTPGRLTTDEAEHDQPYQNIKLKAGTHHTVATVWIDDAPVHDFNVMQSANARRLVACWNLLVDVPTEEIEAAANYGAAWGKTGLELAAVTAELDALRTENARLRAELEAVGAGGVQPLRAQAGWALVPVEPTLEMLEAMHTACLCFYEDDQRAAYHAMLAATPVPRPARRNPQGTPAPQQPAPVPPQKPELRVGQIWLTRGGLRAKIESETPNTPYPFRCRSAVDRWTVTKDGRFHSEDVDAPDDLIELIRDVPQEGGEA